MIACFHHITLQFWFIILPQGWCNTPSAWSDVCVPTLWCASLCSSYQLGWHGEYSRHLNGLCKQSLPFDIASIWGNDGKVQCLPASCVQCLPVCCHCCPDSIAATAEPAVLYCTAPPLVTPPLPTLRIGTGRREQGRVDWWKESVGLLQNYTYLEQENWQTDTSEAPYEQHPLQSCQEQAEAFRNSFNLSPSSEVTIPKYWASFLFL